MCPIHTPAPQHLQDSTPWPQDPPYPSTPSLEVGLSLLLHLQSLLTPFTEASSSLPLPAVLTAPIRLDVVAQVHSMSTTICSSFLHPPHTIVTQRALQRTNARRTPSAKKLATKPPPNHGVLVAL